MVFFLGGGGEKYLQFLPFSLSPYDFRRLNSVLIQGGQERGVLIHPCTKNTKPKIPRKEQKYPRRRAKANPLGKANLKAFVKSGLIQARGARIGQTDTRYGHRVSLVIRCKFQPVTKRDPVSDPPRTAELNYLSLIPDI